VSEFEIALLFPLCVASFAAFLFALSPRLYCEGVERWVISSVLRSKIRTERTERAKDFFVCGDEIQRWWAFDLGESTQWASKSAQYWREKMMGKAIHGKY
jgi:hypothetical protein